jgi:hypothetical protein
MAQGSQLFQTPDGPTSAKLSAASIHWLSAAFWEGRGRVRTRLVVVDVFGAGLLAEPIARAAPSAACRAVMMFPDRAAEKARDNPARDENSPPGSAHTAPLSPGAILRASCRMRSMVQLA